MGDQLSLPKIGQTVYLRNRPAVVRSVSFSDASKGERLLYLEVEYIDGGLHPDSDRVIWELESNARILSRQSLPKIDQQAIPPDPPERFRPFISAFTWSATNRLTNESGSEENQVNLISPWQNAIQIEDYQIYPVLKSLLMPRISLLLADDVGLGKTIEAGLIISELFAKRRARRVMVVCPASLQSQWQEELKEKFHLDFEIVDRDKCYYLQRTFGVDSNAWVTYPKIITSMDYLRQPDVLESFIAASKAISGRDESILPWQVLVVDEAHNLSPKHFRDESERCKMLRQISRFFDHKLFLTATPHNGYTESFTGLLELMDPVRFQQKCQLDESDYAQIHGCMIRRLKSELDADGEGNRFPKRMVEGLNIPSNSGERAIFAQERVLFDALREYREALRDHVAPFRRKDKNISEFLSILLTKRLLSSSFAFACTWWQHVAGLELSEPSEEEVEHIITRASTELVDEEERNSREQDAVRISGAWLLRYADKLTPHMRAVDEALKGIGLSPEVILRNMLTPDVTPPDSKWERLCAWINDNLLIKGEFRDNERLIIFTEYKNTLDYLISRFKNVKFDEPQIEKLFGGASADKRERIKDAFNDPESPVRILVATDVASEGLNLQKTCRYVIHFDIPWNPMKLEQRNGRVDRHGQIRDVFVYHFTSDDEADLKFMSHVVKKVNQAREDLGSLSQVLDRAILEHFTRRKVDLDEIDARAKKMKDANIDRGDMQSRDKGVKESIDKAMQRLTATQLSLGLTPQRIAELLSCSLEIERGSIEETSEKGVYRIREIPPAWKALIKETLEIKKGRLQGSLPKLVFDPSHFEKRVDGRKIYSVEKDKALIRLGHPLMRRALNTLKRELWAPHDIENPSHVHLSRWTIVKSPLPRGIDKLLIMHILLEVTNQLREYVHEEVFQVRFKVSGEKLLSLENSLWNEIKSLPKEPLSDLELNRFAPTIKDNWVHFEEHLESHMNSLKAEYETEFASRMNERLKHELDQERTRFELQLKELNKRNQSTWRDRQRKELEKRKALAQQTEFFDEDKAIEDKRLEELSWQLDSIHTEQMKNILENEKNRILKEVLPRRYALANIDLYPLGVELIVRENS